MTEIRFKSQHKNKLSGDDGWFWWTMIADGREYQIRHDRFHPINGYELSWRFVGNDTWFVVGKQDELEHAMSAATVIRNGFRGKRRKALA